MDRQPVLVVTKGPIEVARFPVEADGLTLGRDEECSVVLDDPNVALDDPNVGLDDPNVVLDDLNVVLDEG